MRFVLALLCALLSIASLGAAKPPSPLRAQARPSRQPDRDLTGNCEHPTGCSKACAMQQLLLDQQARGDAYCGVDIPPIAPSPGDGGISPVDRGPGSTDPTDVLTNLLDIDVNPTSHVITGSNTMTIRSNVAALSSFGFKLRSQYTVSSIMLTDDFNTNYSTSVSGPPASSYARTITISPAIPLGRVVTLKISYTGTATTIAGASIVFGTSGGNPFVWTLSEPYYAATWWPCKDGDVFQPGDNSDKALTTVAITVPSTMRAVANGTLTGTAAVAGGKTKYTWSSQYPIASYLVCFAATTYTTWTLPYVHSGGSMPVEFNVFPASDTTTNRAGWEQCIPMLGTFGSLFGPYPFINEKYGIYQFTFSGGMEHQTNTGQGGFSEDLTSHELAHQWFGDNVTCKTWNDIWLNEGFATYGEALWLEYKGGASNQTALHAAMAASSRRPSDVSGTVWCPTTNDINRIFNSEWTYKKAGWVIHMLRHVLGDTKFFQALLDYRASYQGSAASTTDFINSVVASSGAASLDWFFQPWIYSQGAPTYVYAWQSATIDSRPYLRLRVQQTQTSPYPTFVMPIDVRINSVGSPRTVVVYNTAPSQHFLIPLTVPATGVVFDEFNWILNSGKTSGTYVQGPPKVVSFSPGVSSSVAVPSNPAQLRVAFSDDVSIPAGAVVLRVNGNPVAITTLYDSPTRALTVSPQAGGTFPVGSYELTLTDTIVATANSAALDGETPGSWAFSLSGAAPAPADSLPSGNGLAGGAAVLPFTIAPNPCRADFDNSGTIDSDDLFAFLDSWFSENGLVAPPTRVSDINASANVDSDDLFAFLDLWFGVTPCP